MRLGKTKSMEMHAANLKKKHLIFESITRNVQLNQLPNWSEFEK